MTVVAGQPALPLGTPLTLRVAADDRPGPRTYTVKTGDTLFGIATQFGLTTTTLAAANGITDPSRITPGQVLVIPV